MMEILGTVAVAVILVCVIAGAAFYAGLYIGKVKSKLEPPAIASTSVGGGVSKTCVERNFTLKSRGKNGSRKIPAIASTEDVPSASEMNDVDDQNLVSPVGSPDGDRRKRRQEEDEVPFTPVEVALQDIKHYESTIEKSRNVLHSIIGTSRALYNEYDLKRSWQVIFSNGSSQFYTSKAKEDGILIRGVSTAKNNAPQDIVKWLIEEDLITGIEGIANRCEIIQKIVLSEQNDEYIIIRRLCCKAGTLMSSKRDFILITSIAILPPRHNSDTAPVPVTIDTNGDRNVNHSYIVSTRSVPEDFISPQRGAKSGGFIRGLVFGSGYILKAVVSGEKIGTEISYAVHMDMLGSRSGRTNVSKTTTLVTSVVRVMAKIQSGCVRSVPLGFARSNTTNGSVVSDSEVFSERESLHLNNNSNTNNSTSNNNNSSNNEELSANSRIQLTGEEKDELIGVAKTALFKLRNLHAMLPSQQQNSGNNSVANQFKWETFYEQDEVVLRELSQEGMATQPMGILSATCTIEAPPQLVRSLLVDHPDAIDGLLEGRSVLNYLTATTYVQWLAYGAIYPMGAKDFLLVTSEEVFNRGHNHNNSTADGSFIIASTSIDDICEMDPDDEETSAPEEISSGVKKDKTVGSGYNRSCLKLAGYIGVANGRGGTDLTLIIDLDIYSDSPAWLLQLLSQYGLTETMNRIKKTTMDTMNYNKLLSANHSLNMNNINNINSTHNYTNSALLNGAQHNVNKKQEASELSKMLLSIRNREMKMMQYNNSQNNNAQINGNNSNNNSAINNSNNNTNSSNNNNNSNNTNSVINSSNVPYNNYNTNSAKESKKIKRPSILRGRNKNNEHNSSNNEIGTFSDNDNNNYNYNNNSSNNKVLVRQTSTDSMSNEYNLHPNASEKSSTPLKSRFRSNSISSFVMNNSPSLSRKHRKNTSKELPPLGGSGSRSGTPNTLQSSGHGSNGSGGNNVAPLSISVPDARHNNNHTHINRGRDTPPLHNSNNNTVRNNSNDNNNNTTNVGAPSPLLAHQAHRTTSFHQTVTNSAAHPHGTNKGAMSPAANRQAYNVIASDVEAMLPVGASSTGANSVTTGSNTTLETTSYDSPITSPTAVSASEKKKKLNTDKVVKNEHLKDPVAMQGAMLAHTAIGKIQVYLRLPVDHLNLDRAIKNIQLDWTLKVSKPTISIYTSMIQDSNWQAIRAVTVMKADKNKLLSLLTNDNRMGEFDDMFDFFQFIAKVDNHTAIRRVCFKAVWPTAPRDFLICTTHEEQPDGSILIATMSAPDTLCPQQKGFVRGFIQISGYHIQPYNPNQTITLEGPNNACTPLNPGECKVTLTAHSELGGTLPASVINMLSTNAPLKILTSVADIMKKGK